MKSSIREARFTKLENWLLENDAQQIRKESLSNDDDIYWVSVKGRVIIIHEYAKECGFAVYLPSDNSNRIDVTLEALDKFLKVQS